jgi:molybdate/tungstate transport system permease protein
MGIKNRYNYFSLLLTFAGGVLLLFVIAPLLGLFLQSTPSTIQETIQDKEVTDSILLTILTSIAGTLFLSLFTIPAAYVMARSKSKWKQFINGIIDLPIVIPHSAAGIALLAVLSKNNFFGKTMSSIGIDFVGTTLGISIAMAFVSVPYLYNAARIGFENVPEKLEKVAYSLGASKRRTFFTISFPLAWRSILSGLVMMFARGMSEFGAVIIIAYHPMTTPVLIFERFSTFGLKYAQPVAVLFITISLLIFIVMRLLNKKNHDRY